MRNMLIQQGKLFSIPIGIAITAILIAIAGENTIQLLRYDAVAIANHQYWRLFTAHFTHLGWSHLWLNVAGLALVFVFFSACVSPRYWVFSLFISSLVISLLIYYLNPEIRWYVGLSGVLHTLFVLGGIANIWVRKWEGITFTTIILAKVFYEQMTGPLPGSEEAAGGAVLVDAHFYGAMVGLILALPLIVGKLKRTT